MRALDHLVTGFLVLCAGTVTALAARNALVEKPSANDGPRTVAEFESIAAVGQRIGAISPALTIVTFSDFQCPYCRVLAHRLDTLRAEHPDSIQIVFRHLPLRSHAFAWKAAIAAECAAEQSRFAPFHDSLFANQQSIPSAPWTRLADESAIPNMGAFEACVNDERHASAIRRDVATADSLSIRATPGLLVAGRLYVGAPSMEELRQIASAALGRAK